MNQAVGIWSLGKVMNWIVIFTKWSLKTLPHTGPRSQFVIHLYWQTIEWMGYPTLSRSQNPTVRSAHLYKDNMEVCANSSLSPNVESEALQMVQVVLLNLHLWLTGPRSWVQHPPYDIETCNLYAFPVCTSFSPIPKINKYQTGPPSPSITMWSMVHPRTLLFSAGSLFKMHTRPAWATKTRASRAAIGGTIATKANQYKSNNLQAFIWNVGGNWNTQRKPTQAQSGHASSMQIVQKC